MASALSLALSAIALAFSFYVFLASRTRDRRDVLIRMHELLVSDDLERGRALLFEKITDEASVDRLSDQDYHNINRALTAYNLLGLYVKNGYISERDAVDAWGRPIYRSWLAAQPFLAHRERDHGYRPWPYLDFLANKAREALSQRGDLPEYKVMHRSPDKPEVAG